MQKILIEFYKNPPLKGLGRALREASLERLVAYILSKHGCMHPYRLSRILVLANWISLEKIGKPLARFSIEGFEAGFSIPELSLIKEESNNCFKKNKEKKCLEYTCSPPELGEEEVQILDEAVEKTKNLSDIELNRLIIRDARYRELLEKGGF